jgi:hypothetical protein
VLVEHRLHRDHLERADHTVLGEDLHAQVGLAVGDPAAHWRTDARGLLGVDDVHVERDVQERAAGGQPDRLLDDRADPAAVDVVHREDVHAQVAQAQLLALVHAADADEDRAGVGQHRQRPGVAREARVVAHPERDRERHPVHVARRRRLGRVQVGVGVEPDQAARSAVDGRKPSQRADRDRVVAAEHQG